MEAALALTQLETAAVAIGARPSAAGDGVDITTWKVNGQFGHVNCTAYIKSDGAGACTVTSPSGGSHGVEVWIGKTNNAGVFHWWLVGYLNGGVDVDVPNNVGSAFSLELAAIGSRLALAGVPSAHAPTYYFEPIETWGA